MPIGGKAGTGKYALIDRCKYDLIADGRIFYNARYVTYYQKGWPRGVIVKLHRFIVGEENIPKGCVVDHINRDSLDNRLCNLRVCTKSQNAMIGGSQLGILRV